MVEQRFDVSVFPAGAHGGALAFRAAENGHNVHMVFNSTEEAWAFEHTREHKKFPGVIFPDNVEAEVGFGSMPQADVVTLAPRSDRAHEDFKQIAGHIADHTVVLFGDKGFPLGMTTTQMAKQIKPEIAGREAVVGGPNFAKQIVKREPTATVIASPSKEAQDLLYTVYNHDIFQVELTEDVIGVEVAGASKNIDAIALGILAGKKANEMVQALLAVKCFQEIITLGVAMGANMQTFISPAGLGDLLMTGSSENSRNYLAGVELGEHRATVRELLSDQTRTIEGMQAAFWIKQIAKEYGVALPIKELIGRLVAGKIGVDAVYKQLVWLSIANRRNLELS